MQKLQRAGQQNGTKYAETLAKRQRLLEIWDAAAHGAPEDAIAYFVEQREDARQRANTMRQSTKPKDVKDLLQYDNLQTGITLWRQLLEEPSSDASLHDIVHAQITANIHELQVMADRTIYGSLVKAFEDGRLALAALMTMRSS